MRKILIAAALLNISCNRQEQPEAPTAAETERLDEAEEMLNDFAKEEGPATEAADPSNRSE